MRIIYHKNRRTNITHNINTGRVRVMHSNGGFFSCCSVRLHYIVAYINTYKVLPLIVDSSNQFSWYKRNKTDDITFEYFQHYNKIKQHVSSSRIDYCHRYQYKNYSLLQYNTICPVVKKYFSPSIEINKIINYMERKYNINYNSICVLFYRGNDKNRETNICGYNEFINKANMIQSRNPGIRFLIQSDETQFINTIKSYFPNNSFYLKDEIRHINKSNNTVDIVMKDKNYIFSKYYLAITIIMSKCKYVVCNTGNCSIWIALYRGNSKGIIQNNNGKWSIY